MTTPFPKPRMGQWPQKVARWIEFDRLTQAPGALPEYTIARLPSAARSRAHLVFVLDDVGGSVPAFSDGVNWRRVTDRAVVSTI